MLTEEKLNANLLLYYRLLEKYGCYSEAMANELGDKIKYAPYNRAVDNGGAERGDLINVIINKLCSIGTCINNLAFIGDKGVENALHPLLAVNKRMLMRVLLLCNISKCEMFVPSSESWKQKKGINYDFVENQTTMKTGQRSLYLCQKYGIALEEVEFAAFYSIDKTEEEISSYEDPLSMLVRTVKKFTEIELRQEYLQNIHPNEKIEE